MKTIATTPRLTRNILIAMLSGILFGCLLRYVPQQPSMMFELVNTYLIDGLLAIIGTLFISLMKMMVVPVVFVSLVCGASHLGDIRQLGRLGSKTIGLYLVTTSFAITFAMLFASVLHLGTGVSLTADEQPLHIPTPSIAQTIAGLVPSNPVAAMAEGNMLQLIVFAIILGMTLTLAGDAGKRIKSFFQDANEVVMKLIMLVMIVAPVGVFALISVFFATNGISMMRELLGYFVTVLVVLLLHMIVTNSLLLTFLARLNPIGFFKKFYPVMLFGFSTSSSNATLPITLANVENELGVSNRVASFVIPIGATINMDGTAIMQGVATIFLANIAGVALTWHTYLTIILMATMASIGTAGVPGVGMVTLVMVLQQVGLGVEGISLIIGVDRLLDMARTAVNITGDAAVSCVVARSEGLFNEKVFNHKN